MKLDIYCMASFLCEIVEIERVCLKFNTYIDIDKKSIPKGFRVYNVLRCKEPGIQVIKKHFFGRKKNLVARILVKDDAPLDGMIVSEKSFVVETEDMISVHEFLADYDTIVDPVDCFDEDPGYYIERYLEDNTFQCITINGIDALFTPGRLSYNIGGEKFGDNTIFRYDLRQLPSSYEVDSCCRVANCGTIISKHPMVCSSLDKASCEFHSEQISFEEYMERED